MARVLWEIHTHWTWRRTDPVRHIYLRQNQENHLWKVVASNGSGAWWKDYERFEEAMGVIAGMIERTGGPQAWTRRGPDSGGHRNFTYGNR